MEFCIRKLEPQDARAYALCHIACWQAAYRGIVPDAYLEHMSDEVEERTARLENNLREFAEEYRYHCAELDGAMIGRLIYGMCRDEDKPGAGEVQALYLLEEHWGKGFGRRMMDYAVKALTAMGYREIALWALEENRRARRFYEKYGFVLDGAKKEIEIGGKALAEVRYALRPRRKNAERPLCL